MLSSSTIESILTRIIRPTKWTRLTKPDLSIPAEIYMATWLLIRIFRIVDNELICALLEVARLLEHQELNQDIMLGNHRVSYFRHLVSQPWDEEGQIEISPVIKAIKSVLGSYPDI